MTKLLKKYKNGNTDVFLFDNGTRIMQTEDDEFDFEYPCNADIKIGNRCFQNCPMCHEKSTPDGKNASVRDLEFLNHWLGGCEVAFGGGSVTENPEFEDILKLAKKNELISNTTFHMNEFISHIDLISRWQNEKLLYGIGVSYPPNFKLIDEDALVNALSKTKNVVFHIIAGLVTNKDMENIIRVSKKAGIEPKVLVLGYKDFGRGHELLNDTIKKHIKELSDNYDSFFEGVSTISIDNLALKQLDMRSRLSKEAWEQFYQGDEGSNNMYIDAVEQKFAQCSIATKRYPIMDSVKDMFAVIKKEAPLM